MAGTIPSLALSTQFDQNGNILAGGKLYFYAANTLTPQDVFSDTGLLLTLPNPITLDASGRVPEFYCADGNIRARLTDAGGVVQFDALNLLVIGPSSGGGGGGTSVDATAIFQTGDCIWLDVSGSRSGWVRDNGRTIGSATSGSSERANADCIALFEWLWNNKSDTLCPVVGGRGASAAADWGANKQITLPDKRGYLPAGLDDMGNSAASRFTGVPFGTGNATTAGSLGGEAAHTLEQSELSVALGTAASTVTDTGHTHNFVVQSISAASESVVGPGTGGSGPPGGGGFPQNAMSIANATTGITVATTITNAAGGNAHNNTPLIVTGTFYRKL